MHSVNHTGRKSGREVLFTMKGAIIYASSLAIGVIVGTVFWNHRSEPIASYGLHRGVPIPDAGLIVDEQGHAAVVNPENGKTGLKKIYSAMTAFRSANGHLPTNPNQLTSGKYGLSVADLDNPDAQYADGLSATRKLPSYKFSFLEVRPDGKKKPSFPAKGERDVWAVSNIYVRRNLVKFKDRTSKMDLQGFYLVLWSDGTISEVKPQEAKFAMNPIMNRLSLVFPGQAGLEHIETSTHNQMFAKANLRQ